MPSTLGAFIRHRRLQLGLTQHQLAVRTGQGTTQVHISRLKSGRVTLPRWRRLRALAAALDVTPGALLLEAGLVATDDLQRATHAPMTSAPDRDVYPRAFTCPLVGAVREWETAAVFTCT